MKISEWSVVLGSDGQVCCDAEGLHRLFALPGASRIPLPCLSPRGPDAAPAKCGARVVLDMCFGRTSTAVERCRRGGGAGKKHSSLRRPHDRYLTRADGAGDCFFRLVILREYVEKHSVEEAE